MARVLRTSTALTSAYPAALDRLELLLKYVSLQALNNRTSVLIAVSRGIDFENQASQRRNRLAMRRRERRGLGVSKRSHRRDHRSTSFHVAHATTLSRTELERCGTTDRVQDDVKSLLDLDYECVAQSLLHAVSKSAENAPISTHCDLRLAGRMSVLQLR